MSEKVHRGEILKAAVKDSGLSIDLLMKKLGYGSRNTYYFHTKKADLPLSVLKDYGKALQYDFSHEIPELRMQTVQEEDDRPYLSAPKSLEEAVRQRDFYLKLYLRQLEDYRKLEEEMSRMKRP